MSDGKLVKVKIRRIIEEEFTITKEEYDNLRDGEEIELRDFFHYNESGYYTRDEIKMMRAR